MLTVLGFRQCGHFKVFPPRESGSGFNWCETDSRCCNALPWFLVSIRTTNWGLSGVSGKSKQHLGPLCSRQSNDEERNSVSCWD